MTTLFIQLNQVYKSFNNGFNCNLEGNLIILSGVNGSGKSQLLDIISKKRKHPERPQGVSASIKLNDSEILHQDVLYRSFKDNTNIPPLTRASTDQQKTHSQAVYSAYRDNLLDISHPNLWQFQTSATLIKGVLIDKYGPNKFNMRAITQSEVGDAIPADFIWRPDDIFTNAIGDLFFNYALKELHGCAEKGRTENPSGEAFDSEKELGPPPWKLLNSLFAKLGFSYRFKEKYSIIAGARINEQPAIYSVNEDGSINLEAMRNLEDLSDGEKAIISLSFASLSDAPTQNIKILLLDEYDATFNPSLVEMFYKVLDEYFISKGILVIIATHSPATISLAPENASFYEVFKPNAGSNRILPVHKDNYLELQIANRGFYSKINDQHSRIKDLEEQNANLEKIVNDLKIKNKHVVFTEGDKDTIILSAAWSKLYPEKEPPFLFMPSTGADTLKKLMSTHYLKVIHPVINKKGLALFDFDREGYNQWNGIKDWTPNDHIKTSPCGQASAILLPIPSHLRSYVYNSKDDLHQPNDLKLEIEHLLIAQDGNTDAFMALCPNAADCGRNYYEIGCKRDSLFYRDVTAQFTAENFENFIPLFQRFNELLDKKQEPTPCT